ncbi:MAG: TonB C-terminal domain-containing protein, partial [Candidatus Melainabacteria bacterium]|nr:TonB C-terminal domain-containing protein [Candidatus Melainabacteria bacterium]
LALTRPDLIQPKTGSTAESDPDDEEEEEPRAAIDFGLYMTQMKQTIQKHWQPPKGFENRRVVATFTILRDGTITNAELVDPSGIEAVDKSALNALRVASPLDPLPLGAPKSVQIRYQFDWHVTRN